MKYLLDTCVLSEFVRRKPDVNVVEWFESAAEDLLYLRVITIGEIQREIEQLPESRHKTNLLTWLSNDLLIRFEGRILAIETDTMLIWGSMTARMEQIGIPMSVMDGLIAAGALQHNLTLVTRNVGDFSDCGMQLINPWR